MPQLRRELHDRWAKWVLYGNFNVHGIRAPFIRRVWRTWKGCYQVREVTFYHLLGLDIGFGILANITQLFHDPPNSI